MDLTDEHPYLFSHRFNIEFNKDKHDYNTRCKNNIRKSASSRNWGHGPRQILPQTIGIN